MRQFEKNLDFFAQNKDGSFNYNKIQKYQKQMINQPEKVVQIRKNHFESFANPEDNPLSASRFSSPSLKLGRVRSWKFIYKSPTRVEHINQEEPLAFNKHAHKLVVRKLPKFHQEIRDNDPMKNHKIIENINFFREQEKRKSELTLSQVNGLDKSKVYNDHFEVSRVLVDLKDTKHPSELRMHRSLSCSYKALESSRMSVIEGLKSGESLFQSMVKQEGPLFSSRVIEVKKPQTNVNLAESQYFAGIIGK